MFFKYDPSNTVYFIMKQEYVWYNCPDSKICDFKLHDSLYYFHYTCFVLPLKCHDDEWSRGDHLHFLRGYTTTYVVNTALSAKSMTTPCMNLHLHPSIYGQVLFIKFLGLPSQESDQAYQL